MAIEKKHFAFHEDRISYLPEQDISAELALVSFLMLLKNDGRSYVSDLKQDKTPKELVDVILSSPDRFEGFGDDNNPKILQDWLADEYLDVRRIKKPKEGEPHERIISAHPLHLITTRLRARDFSTFAKGTGKFLYSALKDEPQLTSDLLKFFKEGYNEIENKLEDDTLDVDTALLVSVLQDAKDGTPDFRESVEYYPPFCVGQSQLLADDLRKLIRYHFGSNMPRRELLKYMVTIIRFHLYLYTLRVFREVNQLWETKKYCANSCKVDPSKNCPFESCTGGKLNLFVDFGEDHRSNSAQLAMDAVQNDYQELHRYIKNQYRLKKLMEFADDLRRTHPKYEKKGNETPWDDLVLLLNKEKDLAQAFFSGRRQILISEYEDDEEIIEILKLPLSEFDRYVEIVFYLTAQRTHIRKFREMMDSISGKNQEYGILRTTGGRKATRRYAMGSVLLEVLAQLAVVHVDPKKGYHTHNIGILEFIEFLKNRYGILIDTLSDVDKQKHIWIQAALSENYLALRNRLRMIGFYTDLSDASNVQEIVPRFRIGN